MNIAMRSSTRLLTLILSVLSLPAAAQLTSTAQIELNGNVQAGTCTAAGVTKTFPTVSAGAFPQTEAATGGVAASYTDIEIALTDCTGVTGATFQIGVRADASSQPTNVFRNKATDGAPFTSYWIREGAGACATGRTVAPGAALSRDFAGSSYNLELCAQYHKNPGGLVSMGPLSTNFTVTITYR